MSSIGKVIEITAIPHGPCIPGWVRAGWVGVQIPCAGFTCGHLLTYARPVNAPPRRKGLVPGKEFFEEVRNRPDQQIDGFQVYQDLALQALEVHAPAAAQWFYDHGYPGHEPNQDCFGFKMSEVKALRYYTDDEITALKAA